jgi:hypothetical protein
LQRVEARADDVLKNGLTKLNAEEKAVLEFLKRRIRKNGSAKMNGGGSANGARVLREQLSKSIERVGRKNAVRGSASQSSQR